MKLIYSNFKKLLFLLLAIIACFTLVACGNEEDEEAEKILREALGSITIGDVSSLKNDFDISNFTNRHNLPISWQLIEADETLNLVKKDDNWTTVVVTPTKYTEDENGNQTNGWGKGTLRATVEYNGKTSYREWKLNVVPGEKSSILAIADARKAAKGTGVEVVGTVSFVTSNGFVVEDSTGGIYVYTSSAPAANVKPGAEVNVKGKTTLYNYQPEIESPTVKVTKEAPATGYDYSKAPSVEIKDLINAQPTDLDHYNIIVRITGQVVENYVYNDKKVGEYAIKDILTGAVAVLHDSTSNDVKSILKQKVGQYVSITVLAYDFHTQYQVWRHYGIVGTVEDAEAPSVSDDVAINNIKEEVEKLYKGKSFYKSLDLITSFNDGTITWSSNKPEIIANDGTYTKPSVDTEVELTYTIKVGNTEKTFKLTVTALALNEITIKEALAKIDQKEQIVMIKGVIIGQDADGYYYLADNTGVIYVREKLGNLKVGDTVRVIGSGYVYNLNSSSNPNQYIRQISGNYEVEKINETITPIAVVDANISDFDLNIPDKDFTTKVPAEELYGKIIKFTDVYLVVKGSYNNVYIATENSTNAPSLYIYYKSVGVDDLKQLQGKKVTITVVVYGYATSDGWRLGFLNREGDVTYSTSDEELLAKAKEEIEKIVSNGKEVTTDLTFPEQSSLSLLANAKYVWESSNTDILSNTGKYTSPSEDTEVTVTVKVYLDGNTSGTPSATYSYKVVVKVKTGATVAYNFDFGTEGKSGYNDGQDKEFIVKNTVTNTDFTFKSNTVQTATSNNAPHNNMGAFLVMAVSRDNSNHKGYSYFEFDLTGLNIVKIEFDYSWWSSSDAKNKNKVTKLELQVWNETNETWETAKSFLDTIDASVYKTLSYDVTSGTKFRIYGEVEAGTSKTNARVTIDNIKFYN